MQRGEPCHLIRRPVARSPLQDRGELANLVRDTRNSRLAERDDILGELERRGAVVIQVLPHRIGEGRRIDALDVE